MTDEERQEACGALRSGNAHYWKQEWYDELADEIERLANSLSLANDAWAKGNSEILRLQSYRDEDAEGPQSDAKPKETWNKQSPGPDSILHELGDCPTQSDAKPAQSQTLLDAAENLLIAIGMGWDIEGCVENLRAALAQSDAKERREEELREDERLGAALRRAQDAEDRLAALAQSDAEPSQNLRRPTGNNADEWQLFLQEWLTIENGRIDGTAFMAVQIAEAIDDTAPPRPDTSAGLIEAAEFAKQCANGSFSKNEAMYLRGFADRLRARAADRSKK